MYHIWRTYAVWEPISYCGLINVLLVNSWDQAVKQDGGKIETGGSFKFNIYGGDCTRKKNALVKIYQLHINLQW